MRLTFIFSFVFAMIIFSPQSGEAQTKVMNLFRKYRNDEGVKHMNLAGDITKMLQSKNEKLQSRIDEMHVYIFSKNKVMSASDKTKLDLAKTADGFESIFQTREKGSFVELFGIESGGKTTHLFAELKSGEMQIYLVLTGQIVFSELSKMKFDFEGADMMKKIPVP